MKVLGGGANPNFNGTRADGLLKGNCLAFSWLQVNLLNTAQHLYRAHNTCFYISKIQLHRFCTVTVSGICYGYLCCHTFCYFDLLLVQCYR